VSSMVSHRERVLQFQARQLLMEQLRRSVEPMDNERRSRAQGVAELPRENSTPRKACLVLIGRRSSVLNELSVIPERR
jgi:hypothetical protein